MAVIQVADAIANASLTAEEKTIKLAYCNLETVQTMKTPFFTNNPLLFNNQCLVSNITCSTYFSPVL